MTSKLKNCLKNLFGLLLNIFLINTLLAFNAFLKNDPAPILKRLMNESRYRAMEEEEEEEDDAIADAELAKLIKEASARASKTANRTFRDIRRLLVASGFDWSKARILSITTVVRTEDGVETRRVPYDQNMTEQRLPVHLLIESCEKKISLKLEIGRAHV